MFANSTALKTLNWMNFKAVCFTIYASLRTCL